MSFSPALADQFNINVSNGDSHMLFVVIYDLNTRSSDKALDATLNPGQQVPVYITGNAGSDGRIRWEAQTTDRQSCGSSELSNLGSGSNISVTAGSSG